MPWNRTLSRSQWALLAALWLMLVFAFGCSTRGATSPGRFEEKNEHGFVISQQVGVSSSVRSDFKRAVRLMEQGDYTSAATLLERVTAEAPQVTAAHINLGIAQSHLDDLEAAEASMQNAVESDPRHPVAHNELGIVYRKRGRFEEARRSYEQALDIYPAFHYARRNLAILCDLYLADARCALEQYEHYQRDVPDDKKVAMWIADLKKRTGR